LPVELSGLNLVTPDARHRRPLKFLQSHVVFQYRSPETAMPSSMKYSQSDSWMVALRRFRPKRG
jgi:hypothetical protein